MATTLPPDPYQLLGVSTDAKLSEIRSAHRKLVLKCHPDKVQDAALKAIKQDEFQKVQQAYELLSDDNRRMQYDDQVKLFELRKEMSRGNPTPRSNPFEYQVRTAEPRPSSYERPAPASNVYTYPAAVPRSHEHLYEEPLRHAPKKSSSYDNSDRKRREEEWRDDEERLRQREKESKRSAHSKKEKSRDKERRRGAEEKVRTRGVGAYVEDDSDDDFPSPPPRSSDKKSSRHKMEEEIRMRNEEARARERATAEAPRIKEIPLPKKWDEHKDRAAKYMQAARRKGGAEDDFPHPGMRRAETFTPTAAAYNIRYAAPPAAQYSDDESPRRSSARPKESRRASDTPRRDKPSRRSPAADAYIVSPPSPPPTRKPSLQTHSSAPPAAAEFARPKPVPSRSKTQDYPRHETIPPLPRAATFQSGDRGRDRGGSRLRKEVNSDSEPDSPAYASPRHSHSPPPRRTQTQTRYVYQDGTTVPVQPSSRHREELHDLNHSYPRDRSESPHGTPTRPPLSRNQGSVDPHSRTRSQSNLYYGAPHIGPEPIIQNARPKLSPHTDSHRSSSRTVPQFYGEVKYSNGFNNVSYASDPADMYAHAHQRRGSDDRGYYGRRGEPVY